MGQGEEGDLPGYSALVVGVVVKLVHDDIVHRSRPAFPQCEVGKNLGSAANDRGVGVDGGVSGNHSHVLGPEDLAKGEKFFVGQGLDRGGVVGTPPLADRSELHR